MRLEDLGAGATYTASLLAIDVDNAAERGYLGMRSLTQPEEAAVCALRRHRVLKSDT
jgi:hypothetical protein